MRHTRKHELRALLLASITVLWVVAGTTGFAGGVAADEQYELEVTDGAGGEASFLFADLENQLPEGGASGDDTLQVEANDPPLPNYFVAELTVDEESDVTFSEQNGSDIEAVVYGDEVEDSENVEVRRVDGKTLEIEADYDGHDDDPLVLVGDDGEEDEAIGVRVSDLEFDTGGVENATLTWTIRNDVTEYALNVEDFDGDVDADDEVGGGHAYVTAGGENQTMAGISDGGTFRIGEEHASNLVLIGDESDFPDRFTASVNLEEGGVEFHERDPENIVATTSAEGADAEVTSVSNTTIEVSVTDFEGDEADAAIVELDGVTYDVEAEAGPEFVTWEVFDETAGYELVPERLDASFEEDRYEFPRGLDGQPGDEDVTLVVDAGDRNTDGFHAAGSENPMVVEIPESARDDLEFDRSTEPTVTHNGDEATAVGVNRYDILIGFDSDVDSGDEVRIEGVRFNTTAVDERDGGEAALEIGVDVHYEPVDRLETVSIDAEEDAIAPVVPAVDVEGDAPTVLRSGEGGKTGTSSLAINVTDTVGGQMGEVEDIVVELEGDGIAFDDSQELRVADQGSDQEFWVRSDNIDVEPDRIVLSPDEKRGSSEAGDVILLEAADGDGIRFDTTDAESGVAAAIAVTTNAGDAPVTQVTETVAEVSDPQLEADRGTVALGETHDVTVTATDREDEPAENVDVTAESATLGINETVSTGQDGVANFEFDLSDTETVDEIAFAAAVDSVDVETVVHTADIDANVSRIPANGDEATPVEVVVATSDARNDVAVYAQSDELGIETDGQTHEDGSLVFEFGADGDGVIDINATVDDAELEMSVESVAPTISPDPDRITAGNNSTVEVTVEALDEPDGEMDGRSGVEVSAASDNYNISKSNETAADGVTTFEFDLSNGTESGTIELSSTVDSIDVVAVIDVEEADADGGDGDAENGDDGSDSGDGGDDTTDGDDETDGDGTGDDGDASDGEGDEQEGDDGSDSGNDSDDSEGSDGKDGDGDDDNGSESGDGDENDDDETDGDETDGDGADGDDSNTGDGDEGDEDGTSSPGSGGGGGGAAPAPEPDVQIVDADINETVIDVGDAVAVNVTVENVGDADGEFTVRLTSGGFSFADETVEVPAGETREVTLVKDFGEEGTFDLMINDEVEVGTLYVGVEPAEVTASETTTTEDEAPEDPGVRITCENVSVRSITFHDESASGEVTVEDLSAVPAIGPRPDGTVLQTVRIDVPDALADSSATLEFEVGPEDLAETDASADDLVVVHYDSSAGEWTTLEIEVVESDGDQVVVAAETPGFSTFAVTAPERQQSATPTETPAPTETPDATDSPTERTESTEAPPEEQSGFVNPFVMAGFGLLAVLGSILVIAGKRYYLNRLT